MNLTIGTEGLGHERIQHISEIVAAYVSNNHVAPADLPALIASVHAALMRLTTGIPMPEAEEPTDKLSPSQIRKSVRPDGLVSFLDGKPYQTLKRHLTAQGLTPETYRQRFGLPDDYPMTALAYSEKRSALAKAAGLGVVGSRTAHVDASAPKRQRKAD